MWWFWIAKITNFMDNTRRLTNYDDLHFGTQYVHPMQIWLRLKVSNDLGSRDFDDRDVRYLDTFRVLPRTIPYKFWCVISGRRRGSLAILNLSTIMSKVPKFSFTKVFRIKLYLPLRYTKDYFTGYFQTFDRVPQNHLYIGLPTADTPLSHVGYLTNFHNKTNSFTCDKRPAFLNTPVNFLNTPISFWSIWNQ